MTNEQIIATQYRNLLVNKMEEALIAHDRELYLDLVRMMDEIDVLFKLTE